VNCFLELECRRRPSWLGSGPVAFCLSPLPRTPLPYDVEILVLAWKGREAVDEDVEIELVPAIAKQRHFVENELIACVILLERNSSNSNQQQQVLQSLLDQFLAGELKRKANTPVKKMTN